MNKKIRIGLFTVATLTTVVTLTACGGSKSSSGKEVKLNIAGSTALQPLVEANQETYVDKNPGAQISVQGGGSGLGLSQVQSGSIQIGNSDLFAEEKDGVDASSLVDYKVAVVGIAPIVNSEADVTKLTSEQLKQIFTGKITNWKEVGGDDQAITVVNRAEGSGTRYNFEKYGLADGVKVIQAQEVDSSGQAVKTVGTTPGAISYVATSNLQNADASITAVKLDDVEPTAENVQNNKWKIWSYEHMYTLKSKETDAEKDFIKYVTENKKIVEELGYLPMSDMKVERSADGKVTDK